MPSFNARSLLALSLNYPRSVYAAVLLLVMACTAMIPLLNIDTDPENMLRDNDPARVFHNRVKQQFSMYDMIVVGVVNNSASGIYNPDSLSHLHRLSQAIQGMDGVLNRELMSLDTVDNIVQEGDGAIRFEWLMQQAPATQQLSAALKTSVERLPLLANTLVSGDGKAAAIYVPVASKDQSYQIAEQIRAAVAALPDGNADQFHITGLPVAEDQFGVEMFVQMGISAPLAGLAIFLLMWVFFRSLPLVTGPMIVAMATVLITMGLLIGMGFTVHIMSSMIAIFLMPIAVVDSTHILSEFADRFRPGEDPKAVITKVMEHLFTPMLYTSVTSAVGFLSLMLTPIPPVKVFGAFIGFGIFLAFLLTVVFIPAYISRMSPQALSSMQQALHRADNSDSRLARWLPALGVLATRRRTPVLLVSVALFAISAVGISRIQINDNPVNWFKSDHEIRVADRVLNDHFAGTYDAWLVLESQEQGLKAFAAQLDTLVSQARQQGTVIAELPQANSGEAYSDYLARLASYLDDQLFDADDRQIPLLEQLLALTEAAQEQSKTFLQPEVLAWMSGLQQAMLDSGLAGKVNALPDVVSTVNRELRSGLPQDFRVPDSARGVAQALLQYQSSHRPQDLWHFVTPDYRSSLMWLQLTSGDNSHMTAVVNFVDSYIADHPLPQGLSHNWAGKAYLNVIWQDAMVSGMIDSLLSSFLVVFVIMVVLFRSFKYGLLAMLPLTFTITFIYGLIGWIGKDYDMPIAVLSALTLGLSVDFAIHFLQRFRELRRTLPVTEATAEMFLEPGRAISRNAIVIAVGFTPLLFAPLVPYITVGVFLASIMAASALVTLVLLPALLNSPVTGKI